MHTDALTNKHTHSQTHTHMNTHTIYTRTMHTHTYAHVHITYTYNTHTHTHTPARTHTHTHTHAQSTHTHTRIHTGTHAHTHMHTHTHAHTHTRTHTHTHAHTHVHTCAHTRTHTLAHTHTHTHVLTCAHTHAHTHTHTQVHTLAHTHTHTHTHTRTHTHTCTHAHTHAHTQVHTRVRGKKFTKLDLSQAYQQLPLHPDSRKYVVINTHKGLFQYTRLPYGISSAPEIFQKEMDNLLAGIPGVAVYLDDILVTGVTEQEHLKSLEEVLRRLGQSGLRVKKKKCLFMVPSVSYLGHKIDADGLHPLPDKLQVVKAAPTPTNVSELKSYLGLLTYYGKFLPNLSTHLEPLYRLLAKDSKWKWTKVQEKAFEESKNLLQSSQLLVHFNPELQLILACDASAFGIGAVLAHRMPDGYEKPIGYASRTLNKAERNYSQLEKEGLLCVFGVKHFYSYLFGHPFELVTDHKPLLGLLGENKPTSPQASARIRRWALYLSMFEYTLKFRRTTAHCNADALSRLPLPVEPAIIQTPPELVLLTEHLDNSPVTADQIRARTRRDPVLSQVVQFLQQGWPTVQGDTPQLAPFFCQTNRTFTV